jgi:hypothetical protein
MKTNRLNFKALGISIAASALLPPVSTWFFSPVPMDVVISRLLFPLCRLSGFIAVGLVAGQLIEGLGWTRQVAVVARPFFRFSANAMLAEYHDQEKISRTQLFLSNYINQFPAFFLHLPTTMFIVLPLTGPAGGLYFLLTFLAVLLRTSLFLMFGHLYLKGPQGQDPMRAHSVAMPGPEKKSVKEIFLKIRQRLPARIGTILVWVVPIYSLVFILHWNGVFDVLNTALSRTVALNLMPVESLSVVILSFAAEFTSGFAAAGALMHAGVLTVKQTVLALLLGNILAFPIRALRHQLPRYLGIFSPKIGLPLLLSGQLFRVISIILVGTLYYLVVP